jgi:mannose-6-phosphate isomerase-like protein (cupin superfamily)
VEATAHEGRLRRVHRDDAMVFPLPGRSWRLCIGPENTGSHNLTVGVATFPEGSAPAGHVHEGEEEVVYVLAGHGQLVTPDGTVDLEPGVSVYVPVGLHHATVSLGPGELDLLSIFSPPVVPGSYEATDRR